LAETLDSVLAQPYIDRECINVNDGSNDIISEIAYELTNNNSRINYLYKNNSGLRSSSNSGIKFAKAEFILPLDADYKIAPFYLSAALLIFSEKPFVKIVYGKAYRSGAENCF